MPTTEVKRRRGTTAQNNAFTGAVGELSVDTDRKELRLHDGSTAGGKTVNPTVANTIFPGYDFSGGNSIPCGLSNTFFTVMDAGMDEEIYVLDSMSDGQVVVVLVANVETAYTISEWSGVYWPGGTMPALSPASSGFRVWDIFTFIKLNGRISGSAVQNFSEAV